MNYGVQVFVSSLEKPLESSLALDVDKGLCLYHDRCMRRVETRPS